MARADEIATKLEEDVAAVSQMAQGLTNQVAELKAIVEDLKENGVSEATLQRLENVDVALDAIVANATPAQPAPEAPTETPAEPA